MAAIVVVIIGGSEGRDVATSGGATSHGREAGRVVGIFPFESVRGVIRVGVQVGVVGVFSLNKEIFTLNITASLLLKFNNSLSSPDSKGKF